MKNSTSVWIVVLVLGIAIAGGLYVVLHSSGTQTGSPPPITEEIPGDNLTLGQDSSATLGSYLIGYNGMTLYTYLPDTIGLSSNCTGQCAVQWPPYVVTSTKNLIAEAPITGTISTIKRTDGRMQVTYKGHPLYFYKGDVKPNDTNGEGLEGTWYVMKP